MLTVPAVITEVVDQVDAGTGQSLVRAVIEGDGFPGGLIIEEAETEVTVVRTKTAALDDLHPLAQEDRLRVGLAKGSQPLDSFQDAPVVVSQIHLEIDQEFWFSW